VVQNRDPKRNDTQERSNAYGIFWLKNMMEMEKLGRHV
jgi:hypothetical protein